MHQSQITPEFLRTLGQAVLDFGFMESAIRTVVVVLSREGDLAKALIPSGNGVSQNLDLLRRLCYYRIDTQALDPWLAAIDDIQVLFVERNRIFHGMFFEHEAKLFLAKARKGKRGAPDEWAQNEFDTASIPGVLKRLADRRRQLMDFVDDYAENDDGPPHTPSQEAHPSLSVRAVAPNPSFKRPPDGAA